MLTGYNGSFEFKEPGQEYGEYPYVGMRVVRCCITRFLLDSVHIKWCILSLSFPLFYIHPLCSHIITSGVCDYGSSRSPISVSNCLGIGSFQYCIITDWCINDLWNRYPHSLSVHSSWPSTTLLCHAVDILYCQIHQLQERVGLLVHTCMYTELS